MPDRSEVRNVFVLGLDDHNHALLRRLPDADRYHFHPLLTIDELQHGDDIPVAELLDKAERQLDSFDGTVDAIIGFWDFPVTTMVPILSRSRGLPSASLEAVLRCEHKYWSRLEQREVIDEVPRFGLVDLVRDQDPPDGVRYPMWVKPVKAFSSDLAFGVSDLDEFRVAVTKIRKGIGRVGEPFSVILDHAELPPEIAEIGGVACLAEEEVDGRQLTIEGYVVNGDVRFYGVVDSVTHEHISSFVRFQYPSVAPTAVTDRIADISRKVIGRLGLDNTTFNIEFFWDEETDQLNVLEVNPRHSQSHAELFEQVDGVSNHQAMVHLALGEDPVTPFREGPYPIAAKWFLRHYSDGVLSRVPDRDELARVEREVSGVSVDLIVHVGDRLSDLGDQDSYSYKMVNIYIGAADEDELITKFARCVEMLPFEFSR